MPEKWVSIPRGQPQANGKKYMYTPIEESELISEISGIELNLMCVRKKIR